jgi:L-threonylcarbamoyladenylate synthase
MSSGPDWVRGAGPGNQEAVAAEAAELLARGAVIAVPTDTVYGLAARLDRAEALAGIYELKGRPEALALPVLVGATDHVQRLIARWPRTAATLAARFWPGGLTLVVPATPEVGARVGGDGATVGIRYPAHPFFQALCRRTGPLAVTSANRHGEPPCTSAAEVVAAFGPAIGSAIDSANGAAIGLVVDGGRCDGRPSTVVDCAHEVPTCLREGAVPWAAVLDALG